MTLHDKKVDGVLYTLCILCIFTKSFLTHQNCFFRPNTCRSYQLFSVTEKICILFHNELSRFIGINHREILIG